MAKFFMFRGVDFQLGYTDFINSESKNGVSACLNIRNLGFSQKDFSYRVINHWESNKLIDSGRTEDKGWRKFSIADLVWLHIIKELRAFGFPLCHIKKIRESFSENKTAVSEFPLLEYYISLGILGKAVFLLVFPWGEAHPLTESEYLVNRELTSGHNHIQINLSVIIRKVLPDCEWDNLQGISEINDNNVLIAILMLRLLNFSEILVGTPDDRKEMLKFRISSARMKAEGVIRNILEKNITSLRITPVHGKELSITIG